MKSLFESILSSTNSGKKVLIDKIQQWLDAEKLGSVLEVNPNCTVSPIIKAEKDVSDPYKTQIFFNFEHYKELPDFIKLKGFEDRNIDIIPIHCVISHKIFIDSFNGFPDSCRGLTIKCDNKVLPPLKMNIKKYLELECYNLQDVKGMDIQFSKDGSGYLNMKGCRPGIKYNIKGVKMIDFCKSVLLRQRFESLFSYQKDKLNKIRDKYEFPCTQKTVDKIEDFFKDIDIDTKDLVYISFNDSFFLKKKNDNWYRFKKK